MHNFVEELLHFHIAQTATLVVGFQFVQIRIFGQIKAEVFRTAESIQVSEYGVAFQFSGVLHTQVVGVGIHALHFLLHFVGGVREINTVAEALAHFGFTVCSRQAQAGGVLGQQYLGLNEGFTIYIVETAYDFTRLFNHRLLVFAHGHGGGSEGGNVRCLADGVGEETYGDACLEVAHLDFGLYRRVTLQAAHGHQVHIVEGQFAEFRYLGLDEDGTLRRVQSASQVVQCHLDDVLAHLFRVLHIVRQCLCVSDEDENLVIQAGVLQFYSSSQ